MNPLICFLLIVFFGGNLYAVGSEIPVNSPEVFITPKQFEQQTGRKLKLHERIAFRIVQKQNIKNKRKASKANKGKKKTWLATVGVLLGLASFFALVFPPLIFLAIPGLIFSGIAMNKANKNPEEYGGKPAAFGGLILSIVVLTAGIGLFIAYASQYG